MALNGDSAAITFTEVDEVNHPTATYIYSEPAAGPPHLTHETKHGERWGRVDVAVSDKFLISQLNASDRDSITGS